MNEAAVSPHICQTPKPEHIHQNPTEPLSQGLGDGELKSVEVIFNSIAFTFSISPL